MGLVGGLVGACIAVLITLLIGVAVTGNLPHATAWAVLGVLAVAAVVTGFLTGSAVFDRASRSRSRLAVFSAFAGAVGGSVIGAVFLVAVEAAYMATFGSWPVDLLDQLLVVLSYPVLGLLGLCLGGLLGCLVGLAVGGAFRLASYSGR